MPGVGPGVCPAGMLAAEIDSHIKSKQRGLSENADTWFWTAKSVKYENVIIGAIKRSMLDLELRKGNTKVRKQSARSFLFIWNYKI